MFKTKKTYLSILLLFTLFFSVSGFCWPDQAAASTSSLKLTTQSASSIGDDSATLNAKVTSVGSAKITEYGFYYGTSKSCSTKQKVGTSITKGKTFKLKLSDLKDDTKYYFKPYAKTSKGIDYGTVKNFKTDQDNDEKLPEVTTQSAGSIGSDSATLNAKVTSVGSAKITEYGFYYGTTKSCSTKQKVGTSIAKGKTFKLKLSDLKDDTKYYFKPYVKTSNGINYGTVKNFQTDQDNDEETPEITTKSAGSIGDDSATLNAKVTSVGSAKITEYGFYYGTSKSCSTKEKVGTSIAKGKTFKLKLSDLKDGTKYYFKAYAKNSSGTDYGTVKNFKTK